LTVKVEFIFFLVALHCQLTFQTFSKSF